MQYTRISKMVREKIVESHEFKTMRSLTYNNLVNEICKLHSIGGMIRNTPHRFICLIHKLDSISLIDDVVAETLEGMKPQHTGSSLTANDFKGNVYLVAAFLFYLRLSVNFHQYKDLIKYFEADFRKITVVNEQNTRFSMYMDVFVDDLLNKPRILGVCLHI
ncbi:hypothetical protein HK407_05g08600 [Ordospora pajunii]|jgi:pre-mRNA-splicing factor 38A|uniref:uncharacterized protein n=1 Tax=Ordospora pajunii TaxID=3039483 RepID=UPI0029528B59|nr:uncharacterized protein HK407_05g08600 [Ordospora pajunii]KAH9411485.1 hypothetical protein HK407_05g08600 [Ordospora pajunii]